MTLRRAAVVVGIASLLVCGYVVSWFSLWQLHLVYPTANFAYFYYGEKEKYGKTFDMSLYLVYFPAYWIEERFLGGSRYGIHWTDRKETQFPTARELLKEGYTDQELREIGFTESEIREAQR